MGILTKNRFQIKEEVEFVARQIQNQELTPHKRFKLYSNMMQLFIYICTYVNNSRAIYGKDDRVIQGV